MLITLLLLALLLAGCQGGPIMSFSAEQAAVTAATNQVGGRATVIDPQSVQVLQSQALGDRTFVMVRYEQVSEGRQEKCLSMYETARSAFGMWSPRSGGGGCSGQIGGGEPPPEPPLEMGGGRNSGGGPNEPGFSYVNGMVNLDEIEQVRVTWEDEQQQVVPVVNDSYLAVRSGSFAFTTVEGLNADEEVVHTNIMETAPGKAPGKEIEP